MPLSINTLLNNFSFLDEWEDRYRYLIEIGRTLPALSEQEHNEETRVRGCASQVWLVSSQEKQDEITHIRFRADSDAHIVRGLLALLLALYDDKTPQEILSTDAEAVFRKLGFSEHLSQQRSNGLKSILERIRFIAQECIDKKH